MIANTGSLSCVPGTILKPLYILTHLILTVLGTVIIRVLWMRKPRHRFGPHYFVDQIVGRQHIHGKCHEYRPVLKDTWL